jgi:hypothetical protein
VPLDQQLRADGVEREHLADGAAGAVDDRERLRRRADLGLWFRVIERRTVVFGHEPPV